MISAADLMVRFRADTKDAEAGIQRVNKGITGLAKSATATMAGFLGAQAFTAVARGFAGAGAAALDFGAQMANVNSIAQLSDDAFQALNDQVLALTQDPRIAQAPATLAAGLYDVYSSGFQGADGLRVLEQSALAATAGVTDTATAARVITANLNAFGLGADQAQRVSDVLFQTVADGVITFEQLAANMGNTIPIANALGLSVEDVGAAYAQMTLKGVPASQAETQIAGLMRSALNPTEALTEAVQAHGFASATAAIESEGLAGFLDIVNDAAGGNQETMFDLLGTQEAMNAATILGADGAKAYRDELDKMKNASKGAGATNKALEKQMQSASFQIAKMKQQVLTLATIGFGILAPAIGGAARAMTSLISKGIIPFTRVIGAAFKGNFQFNKVLNQVPQPLRRMAHAIGVVVEGLSDIVSIFRGRLNWNRLPGELRQIAGGFRAIGEEVLGAASQLFNLGVSLATWTLTVGVPAVAGWLVDHAGDAWNAVTDLAGWTWDAIQDVGAWTLEVAVPTIKTAVEDLSGWVGDKLHDDLTNKIVADAVDWQLNLNLPEIGMPVAFQSGEAAGRYIREHLVEFVVDNFSGWKLILAIPAALLVVANFPAVIGGLIVKKLTGMGPVELVTWILKVGIPSAFAFAAGLLSGLIPDAIESRLLGVIVNLDDWLLKVGDAAVSLGFAINDLINWVTTKVKNLGVPDVPLPTWNLDVFTPDVSLGFGLSDLTDWVKDKVVALGKVVFDIVPDIKIPLPGSGDKVPAYQDNRGGSGGGPGGFTQQKFAPPKIPAPDRSEFDSGMSAIVNDLKHTLTDTTYTTTLDADNQRATQKVADSGLLGAAWQSSTFTGTLDADNGPAAVAYTDASRWGSVWDSATFTSIFDIDNGPAAVAYTDAFGWGQTWAASAFTATLYLNTGPAINAALAAVSFIDSLLPHSLAKRGPLSKPASFDYLGDALLDSVRGLSTAMGGSFGGGRHRLSPAAMRSGSGAQIGPNFVLHSDDLIRMQRNAEVGGNFARNFGPEYSKRLGT